MENTKTQTTKWQLMNTAPRDGSDILICDRFHRYVAWFSNEEQEWTNSDHFLTPLCWTSLPPMPEMPSLKMNVGDRT